MKRLLSLLAVLVLGTALLSGCTRMVKVETGTRYVCTYGESLGSDIKQIEVPEKTAASYHVTTKTTTCSRHLQAEDLYLKAQQALKSGDMKKAQTELAAVVALDAGFKQASKQLGDIKSGKKPNPDPGFKPATPGTPATTSTPPGGGKQPGSDGSNPAMDAYRDMVPDVLAGFTAEPITAEAVTLTRSYVPKDKARFDQLIVTVQQCQTPAEATRVRDHEIKPSYSANGASPTVAGLQGYFGTSAQNFAILSLVNGSVLVSLELHATGTKPASLRSDLERIAGQVLD